MSLCEFTDGCESEAVFRLWGETEEGASQYVLVCFEHTSRVDVPYKFTERIDGEVLFVGARVKLARLSRGLDREVFGELVGLSEYEVWRWEVHGVQPVDEVLGKVALGLGYPLGFYEQPPSARMDMGSLRIHYPEELCEVCCEDFAEALCDWQETSSQLSVISKQRASTCNKRLCDGCRVRPDEVSDYCPGHGVASQQLVISC